MISPYLLGRRKYRSNSPDHHGSTNTQIHLKQQFGKTFRGLKGWREVYSRTRNSEEADGKQYYIQLPAMFRESEVFCDHLFMLELCNICMTRSSLDDAPKHQCSRCLRWSHGKCNHLRPLRGDDDLTAEWFCDQCVKDEC
jgi:hypothetical protein